MSDPEITPEMLERWARLGSLARNPRLDDWISLADGRITVRTGKAELGQGIRTAVTAVAADELAVHPDLITVAGPDTSQGPQEGVTAGSGSVEQSVTAVRQACAHARLSLLSRAADHLAVASADLDVADGFVRAPDGRSVSYWDLVGPEGFGVDIEDLVPLRDRERRRWTGHRLSRVDLPDKISGRPSFVHDLSPGSATTDASAPLVHARVVRPAWPGHRLAEPADGWQLSVEVARALDRAVDVVVDGSFVAVVCEREGDAALAAEILGGLLRWEPAEEPDDTELVDRVQSSQTIVDGTATGDAPGPPIEHGPRAFAARYTKPFLLHGSIGPSAAVARWDGSHLRIWSHTQGVELLRPAVADALGLDPAAVDVVHVDGAGAYGHNGADDAAFDAALVAFHRPGPAVKLQWSRSDEHGSEPVQPAMAIELSAGLDGAGRISSWDHEIYSYSHMGRPRATGDDRSGLLAAWSRAEPRARSASRPSGGFHSGAHRNADPLYTIPSKRIVSHHLAPSPYRTSSTRGLGAFANVFAMESFVDELAEAAGAPADRFRIDHLADQRAIDVIEAAVGAAGGLHAPGGMDAPGRGLAFSRYENVKAYVAMVVEAAVDARTGQIGLQRVWMAADAGEVIDPDGLRNQLEGGFVQAASWTLHEEVPVGNRPLDWEEYPILRFSEIPVIETVVIDRPTERPLGAGEASTGPTPAAIVNAVAAAAGVRLRDLPLRPERVLAAMERRLAEA